MSGVCVCVCVVSFGFRVHTVLVYVKVCGYNDYGYCHRAIILLVRTRNVCIDEKRFYLLNIFQAIQWICELPNVGQRIFLFRFTVQAESFLENLVPFIVGFGHF